MNKCIKFIMDKKIGSYLENVSLSKYTTYRVGGIAKIVVYPDNIDKLIELLKYLDKNNIKFKVLGKGSNLIFSSKIYDGVIIILDKLCNIEIKKNIINVEAGYSIIKLSNEAAKLGLSGLEFASGIPGTIGGGVFMNAGAYLSSFSDIVRTVTFLDENYDIKTYNLEELEYSYRNSILRERNYIVLSAELELTPKTPEEIKHIISDRRERRLQSQPLEFPSAGSVFRNPEGDYAGRLIEEAGLKGEMVGGAMVSTKHANFIINHNNATGEDIKELIEIIEKKIKEKYNINLVLEQELVNFD